MFGIMGTSAEFARAAGAKGKKMPEVVFEDRSIDPIIYSLSCVGEISVISTKNGNQVVQTYTNLTDTQVSIQSDKNSKISIIGDVTSIVVNFYDGEDYYGTTDVVSFVVNNSNYLNKIDIQSCTALRELNVKGAIGLTELNCKHDYITSLDLSNNTALTTLYCDYVDLSSLDLSNNTALTTLTCSDNHSITSLDLSNNTALTTLHCAYATSMTSLDLSTNTALTSLSIGNQCKALKTIKYPATNSSVSTQIASAITAATAADGTVYTDSAGAYYSTIETAANNKGWTIEQL